MKVSRRLVAMMSIVAASASGDHASLSVRPGSMNASTLLGQYMASPGASSPSSATQTPSKQANAASLAALFGPASPPSMAEKGGSSEARTPVSEPPTAAAHPATAAEEKRAFASLLEAFNAPSPPTAAAGLDFASPSLLGQTSREGSYGLGGQGQPGEAGLVDEQPLSALSRGMSFDTMTLLNALDQPAPPLQESPPLEQQPQEQDDEFDSPVTTAHSSLADSLLDPALSLAFTPATEHKPPAAPVEAEGNDSPSSKTPSSRSVREPREPARQLPRSWMAEQYLPFAAALPTTAMLLPEQDEQTGAQTVELDLSQSLAGTLWNGSEEDREITPISKLRGSYGAWMEGRKVGAWEGAIVWSNKPGKIRLLDTVTGATLLLGPPTGFSAGEKVHDIAVSPSSKDGKRALLTSHEDGSVRFWLVPDQLDGTELQGWQPEWQEHGPTPSSGAVFSEDGEKILLWSREHNKVEVVDRSCQVLAEYELKGEQPNSLVAAAWSATDADLVTAYSNVSGLHLFSGPSQHTVIPPAIAGEYDAFLPLVNGTGYALLSGQGAELDLVRHSDGRLQRTATVKLALPSSSPGTTDADNWGHMQAFQGRLYLSSSLRGSIFELELAADETTIEVVREFPVPEPVVTFSACPSPASRGADSKREFVFFHPAGVMKASFSLPPPPPSPAFDVQDVSSVPTKLGVAHESLPVSTIDSEQQQEPSSTEEEDEDDEPPEGPGVIATFSGRRRSLEGSIHVEKETIIAVDVAPISSGTSDAGLPIPGSLKLPRTPEPEAGDLGAPVWQNTAAEEGKGKRKLRKEQTDLLAPTPPTGTQTPSLSAYKLPVHVGPPRAEWRDTDGRTWHAPAPPGPTATVARSVSTEEDEFRSATADRSKEDDGELQSRFDKMEKRFEELLKESAEKQASTLAALRAQDKAAEEIRQQQLLAIVSNTLESNISRLIERTVVLQIKEQVLPAVSTLLSKAVEKEVARAMQDTVPQELSKLLKKPEVTSPLARALSASMVTVVERTVDDAVQQSVIPHMDGAFAGIIDAVSAEVREELLAMRKGDTKDDAALASKEIAGLSDSLKRIEGALLSRNTSVAGAVATKDSSSTNGGAHLTPGRLSSKPSPFSSPTVPRLLEAASHLPPSAFPPIPRVDTPVSQYESLFLSYLGPVHEPDFTPLRQLVASAPEHRLEAIFPPGGKSALPGSITLSLLVRLAGIVGNADGKVDAETAVQLKWIRRCLESLDLRDEALRKYGRKTLDNVTVYLNARARKIATLGDGTAVKDVQALAKLAQDQAGRIQ